MTGLVIGKLEKVARLWFNFFSHQTKKLSLAPNSLHLYVSPGAGWREGLPESGCPGHPWRGDGGLPDGHPPSLTTGTRSTPGWQRKTAWTITAEGERKLPIQVSQLGFTLQLGLQLIGEKNWSPYKPKTPIYPQKTFMFRQTFTFVTEIFIKKRGFFWIFWTENDQISQKYVQKHKFRKISVDI